MHINIRPKFVVAAVFVALVFILTSSCRTQSVSSPSDAPVREMTDDLGRTQQIPVQVTRAVSLAPNLTEIVFAVGAGDRLVGRTSYDNYPPEAEQIQTVGDTLNPNIENIIALRPQVVLVSTASQIETFTKTLESQEIRVFVTNPNSLEEIYKSIENIGEIFGRGENARTIVEDLRRRVAVVEENTRGVDKTRVFVQIDKNSLFSIGRDSFITDLIEKAGGVSTTKNVDMAYPKISKETAAALEPDVIILSDSPDNDAPNDVFKNSPAVRNGRVYRINADILSRPGPRVVDALEEIAARLAGR